MKQPKIITPGVYTNEIDTSIPPVVGVPTSIVAFVGYTADYHFNGESYLNIPHKISSFKEFEDIYGYSAPLRNSHKFQVPEYYLVMQNLMRAGSIESDHICIDYAIVPDANTVYYLYHSVKLFYDNGGKEAYIVSVGGVGSPSGRPHPIGSSLINPSIRLNDLLNGFKLVEHIQKISLYACPDAILLSWEELSLLNKAMLEQCANLKTAFSILDVKDGDIAKVNNFTTVIEQFRTRIGPDHLDYAAAYFPFISTAVTGSYDINFSNLFGGNFDQLAVFLGSGEELSAITDRIRNSLSNEEENSAWVSTNHFELLNVSENYRMIVENVSRIANRFPLSGAIAGIYAKMDETFGVWKSPANIRVIGASGLTVDLGNAHQENLTIDPVAGKSINLLRKFTGKGVMVWGGRTLAGNHTHYRYIAIKRTLLYFEHTFKKYCQTYVEEPNNSVAWIKVKAGISLFLNQAWRDGALKGTKPEHAFKVDCSLGTTMTEQDLQNGFMRVQVLVALIRPLEFSFLTIKQKMEIQ